MKQALAVLSEPAYEPVTLAQAKAWCRVDSDAQDDVIELLIAAMREDVENLTHRAFISRQYRLTQDCWEWDADYGARITLQFPPLISVDAFRYIDTDGVLQDLATDQYVVHDEYEPAFIIPAWGEVWPTIRGVPNALQIDFTAGYAPGSPPDETEHQEVLPKKLKLWMETKIVTLFDKRDRIVVNGTVMQIPRDFTDGLLDSLVVGTRLF